MFRSLFSRLMVTYLIIMLITLITLSLFLSSALQRYVIRTTEEELIREVGTYKALSKIHDYLLGEIYEFAGKVRDVNIIKGNFRFAPVRFLESNVLVDR